MELIAVVNLAFSMVGFFFIVRMWKEVKSRRDYYGEHFSIPFGKDRTGELQALEARRRFPDDLQTPQRNEQQFGGLTVEQLQAVVAQLAQQQQVSQPPVDDGNGDLQKIVAAAMAAGGGA